MAKRTQPYSQLAKEEDTLWWLQLHPLWSIAHSSSYKHCHGTCYQRQHKQGKEDVWRIDTWIWDHAINLKPDTTMINSKLYQLSPIKQDALDVFLDENLTTGQICPSKSPMNSLFFFIKKKDRKLQPTQDYQKLNNVTIKNCYPLPQIKTLVDTMAKGKYFCKFNVKWGYNNICIKDGDEWKAVFHTPTTKKHPAGLWEPTVMFFRLTNSLATFQNMMNNMFKELIAEGIMVDYMDDISTYANTLEELHNNCCQIFKICWDNHLTLKLDKSLFNTPEIEFCSLIVGRGKIQMDPIKTQAIRDWKWPECKKDIQSFLGFINFYQQFIKNLAKQAKSLTILMGKTPWKWGIKQELAFEGLKEQIANNVVLYTPFHNQPYWIKVDTSNYAVGAVLSQWNPDLRKWSLVTFISHAFDNTKQNYKIYNKELAAVMYALQQWQHYILGHSKPVEVFCNHKNLQYYKDLQKLTCWQACWTAELQEYNLILTHVTGKLNGKADALSWMANHKQRQDDNTDLVGLPESTHLHFCSLEMDVDEPELETKIGLETMCLGIKPHKGWTLNGTKLVKDRLVFVPASRPLIKEVIKVHHDRPYEGHPSVAKTIKLVQQQFNWRTLAEDVKTYVHGCDICQQTKPSWVAKQTPLSPNAILNRPWHTITADFVGPLLTSNRYNLACIIIDWFTKLVKIVPCSTNITAKGFAQILCNHIVWSHGVPEKIILDWGPQFASEFIKAFYNVIGIEWHLSTAYHPQTDGQSKWTIQEFEMYLQAFVNKRQSDWASWIPMAEFVYNNCVHLSTGYSPFYLNYGHNPQTPLSWPSNIVNKDVNKFVQQLQQARDIAQCTLKQTADNMKKYYTTTHNQIHYSIGDLVMLDSCNLSTTHPTCKLEDKHFGPFAVTEKIGSSSFRLDLPPTWKKIHNIFHESLLLPYVTPSFPKQQDLQTQPPPKLVEGEDKFQVDEILNSHVQAHKIQYLVKWLGYGPEDNTWEPTWHLTNTQQKIAEFHLHNLTAPSPTSFLWHPSQCTWKSS
jgi:hypothetical protein